ncbi:MAG: hypothetical protein PHS14_16970 [Elusimicrobia bacterium]|nr:hypothetical protein [Elusimicrobiota bacterium]
MRPDAKRALAAGLLALASACAPEEPRGFELGLLSPAGPGVETAARAAGMTVRAAAPAGAESFGAREEDRMADWSRLRLLVARAAVRGRSGAFFTLPDYPDGRGPADYPEEWQALARVARETAAMRPVLEHGREAAVPLTLPDGVEARAWRFQGRLYVLLVNADSPSAAIPEQSLEPWRALFEVRADARDLLVACGGGRCLPAGRAVWLEGRL